jgi:uncharacterized protein YjlB
MKAPLTLLLRDDGKFPNSRFPALVYKGVVALPPRDPASAFEQLFARNGWTGSWRNGLYTFQHYHSTAHEVLGVFSGSVRVQLGGDRGEVVTLAAGDVAVVPAGVCHMNVGSSGDFRVVGAYPTGTSPDMQYGKPRERPGADQTIARVPFPGADPVEGRRGALVTLWSRAR